MTYWLRMAGNHFNKYWTLIAIHCPEYFGNNGIFWKNY